MFSGSIGSSPLFSDILVTFDLPVCGHTPGINAEMTDDLVSFVV